MKFVKYILSFLAIFAFTSVLYAQAPPFAWGTAVGGTGDDEARAIAPTTDGGFIAAGFTNSTDGDIAGLSHGGYDYLVVKFDATGNVVWKKTYGGSKDDKAYAITPTSDNGYIVAGTSGSNDGDVTGDNHLNSNNNQPSNDFWIVKIDPVGTIQWAKSYGGGNDDEATGICRTLNNTGYVIGGYSNSVDGDNNNGSGTYDYWVVRIDNNGVIQWQQAYGGKGVDKAFAIANMQDGGYVLTGETLSSDNTIINHGKGDCWVVKLDTGGTLQWQFALGGSELDEGNGIFGTPDNGCIIAASTESSDGNIAGDSVRGDVDGWVIKLNASGGIIWQKVYGGNLADYAESIYPTND
ncbi:MAG TPA: T9SS C-terminal target domain-containing protein, partial [Candidatus Kapabacteria bacterium]|nr:T9SS C-terminal target domain-containing protein [Candidatus Kapabacteria bacterium]